MKSFEAMQALRQTLEEAARIEAHRVTLIRPNEDGVSVSDSPQALLEFEANKIREIMPSLQNWIPKQPVLTRTKEHPAKFLPQGLVEAYETLYIRAYGSDAPYLGDPISIHGSGKALRGRIKTSETEKRAGAFQKKKLSASRTSIIQDQKAFDIKDKIDKKLRRVSREIYSLLNNQETVVRSVCSKCRRLGEPEWKYCPACGTSTGVPLPATR